MNVNHVSPDEAASLHQLAAGVVQALARAGLPALLGEGDEEHVGAIVTLDTIADSGAGVYVRWQASKDLRQDAHRAFQHGEYTHGDLRYSSTVAEALCAAIVSILQGAGFSAGQADDLRPSQVRVLASPETSAG
jgi:hypothetical protein